MRLVIGLVLGIALQPWLVLVALTHPERPRREIVIRCGDTRRADDEALLSSARAAAEVDELTRAAEERALVASRAGRCGQCMVEDHPDAILTIATPVILGSIDKSEVQRVVNEHASQIRYCYERILNREPDLAGLIKMKWVIGVDGKVTQVAVEETGMHNPDVEQCLAAKIKTWFFARTPGHTRSAQLGEIAIVSYPFRFAPSELFTTH